MNPVTATDQRARYTRRLAELLGGEDGTLVLALLQKLRRSVELGADRYRLPRPTGDVVGVWRRDGDEFRRDPARRAEWPLWCDTDRLSTGTPNVVLLGESAARGYFHDPLLTCADALSGALGGRQIVDLARTNATATDVLRVALESAVLRPDCVVVFAGNNWHNLDLSPDHSQRIADAIAVDGVAGGRRVFTEEMVAHSAWVLDSLAAVRDVLGVPLVLVVPEFNLADWHDEIADLCPALAGVEHRRWTELRAAAERALDDGNTTAAMRFADELIRLDGGTSPAGWHVLARVRLTLGRPDQAAEALRAARDAVCGVFVPHAPRCFGVVADLMRDKARQHDFGLVDLPAVFGALDPLPGRRLFLDYCHLSRAGIELAMGAVATEVAGGLGIPAPAAVTAPPGPVDAVAHFLAALHNAHYGQPDDVVVYHLDVAVAADDSVLDQFESYLDYQSRRAPHWMCASFLRACADRSIARYLNAADTRLTSKLADHRLRDAIAAVLARHGRVPPDWRRLFVAEHATARVDLLSDACHAETFRQRSGYGLGQRKGFSEIYDQSTRCALPMAEPADVDLAITIRLPATVDEDSGWVTVLVDGTPIREIGVRKAWHTEHVAVPARLAGTGVHTVELRWPVLTGDGDAQLADAVAALERGDVPATLPVFGHIQELIATTAKRQEAS
jgi:hypothetical protein